MNLAVTGGGTGGHIYPAVAVAEYALKNIPGAEILYIGSSAGPEAASAEASGIPFVGLDVAGVAGKNPAKAASALLKFVRASKECKAILRDSGVTCVVGTGGYASAPACRAALKLKIPLILHEMNFDPGLVTRLYSRRAAAVALAHDGTADMLPGGARIVVTGVPVRPHVEALADTDERARLRPRALSELGLEPGRTTLLIFGGSQGARVLNGTVWEYIPRLAERADLQVLHLVGRRDFDEEGREAAERSVSGKPLLYRPLPYLEAIELAYAACDLALTRAGAGTLAELMAIGLPAVLVPFPHAAGGHQEKNARALERSGSVVVCVQRGDSAVEAMDLAVRTISDPDALEKMADAARAATRPDGAKGIAGLIEEVT